MSDKILFIDGQCPRCGQMCGNGGHGPLKCGCGWVGDEGDTKEVEKKLDEIFRQEFPEGESEVGL